MKIRVMLVDDSEVVRHGIASLIRREPDFDIVGEASNGESAVSLVREILPDVILMDLYMPVMDGVQATQRIHNEFSDIRIIGLSLHDEEISKKAMLEAGAVDYFAKGGSLKELIETMRTYFREAAFE